MYIYKRDISYYYTNECKNMICLLNAYTACVKMNIWNEFQLFLFQNFYNFELKYHIKSYHNVETYFIRFHFEIAYYTAKSFSYASYVFQKKVFLKKSLFVSPLNFLYGYFLDFIILRMEICLNVPFL